METNPYDLNNYDDSELNQFIKSRIKQLHLIM